MKLTNKIFWLIWGVCLCCFIVLSITNHGRGEAGGRLMLFSQLFLIGVTALCSCFSKRTALTNLIVAVIFNAVLFFGLFASHGEGTCLLLMLSILFINVCQGIGILVYMLINQLKNKSI